MFYRFLLVKPGSSLLRLSNVMGQRSRLMFFVFLLNSFDVIVEQLGWFSDKKCDPAPLRLILWNVKYVFFTADTLTCHSR